MLNMMPDAPSQPEDAFLGGQEAELEMPPNKMYNELYHKVMQSKSPTRILNNKVSSFEVYKDGWNTLQDRADKSYQR